MVSLFGIESSVGATSPRCPLDRLLFFTLWSDRTIGSSEAGDATVFTYWTDFFLLKDWAPSGKWLDRSRTGVTVGRTGVGRTGVTGLFGGYGAADLNAREAEAPAMSASLASDPASDSFSITGFAVPGTTSLSRNS